MEIVFLIVSIAIGVSITYGIARIGETHKQVVNEYKSCDMLFMFHLVLTFAMSSLFFITLAAMNNTYWNLPYLTI